jgi:hypothetical protein
MTLTEARDRLRQELQVLEGLIARLEVPAVETMPLVRLDGSQDTVVIHGLGAKEGKNGTKEKKENARPAAEKLTMRAAMRQIIAGWSGEFTSDTLREQMNRRHPEMATKIRLGLSGGLRDMVRNGYLLETDKGFKRAPGRVDGNAMLSEIKREIGADKPTED